ncbi:MAG TPA: STAS-like domain-containing protein [Bryobacteraceae bacterium]|nr:STAS-like domain-containing protein [Bryobacteraceae bacterium]
MARALSIETQGNTVSIDGGLSVSDFRSLIATLHNLISERGYLDINLDFSRCSFTHAPPMVALICQCMLYRKQGVGFSLILPKDDVLRRLFVNSSWAHFIDPEQHEASRYMARQHNPVKQFSNSNEQGHLVNEVIDTLLSSFTQFDRSHLRAIEWSLNEITDNVLVHAQSPIGGMIQVTAVRNRKRVEFVVGDAGVGIAKTLRATHREITSDVDALSQAIQEGVTRDTELGQGNGLYGSYRIAIASAGNFSIHSNNATLYFVESTGMHSKSERIPVHGAIVTVGIDYTNPLVLEQALRFNDRPHYPVDRIEMHYERDNQSGLIFIVKNEASSVGSRIGGTPVRAKLLNLIRIGGSQQITVDFSGINMISSSFADEVFGKLFASLGPLDFSSRFKFVNIDPIVQKLIDKAIMQRLSV